MMTEEDKQEYLKHLAKEYKIVKSFAKRVGVKLSKRKSQDSWEWNGKTIATNNFRRPTAHIVHDIAHWLLSGENMRKEKDFGLGSGVESGNYTDILVENPDHEESLASVLGILIERQLGFKWKFTYHEHGWSSYPFREFFSFKTILRERGLTLPGGRLKLLV